MLLVCCRTTKMMMISHVACAADSIHTSTFAVYILHLCVIMTVTATIRTGQIISKTHRLHYAGFKGWLSYLSWLTQRTTFTFSWQTHDVHAVVYLYQIVYILRKHAHAWIPNCTQQMCSVSWQLAQAYQSDILLYNLRWSSWSQYELIKKNVAIVTSFRT